MPGSAAAAMEMKRKRNAEKNKDKEASGPRAAPVLEEGERTPPCLPSQSTGAGQEAQKTFISVAAE